MKVERKIPINRAELSDRAKRREVSTVRQYKRIDDEILSNASKASYAEGIARILRQGCPKFIAKEIEDEFYADRCNELEKNSESKNIFQDIRRRFSGEEQYEVARLADEIEEKPKIMKTLMFSRNTKEKCFRFNGFECAEIMEQAEKIEKYPSLFLAILSAKNDDKSPKFSSKQIVDILNHAYQIHLTAEDVKKVVDLKDKNGKQLLSDSDCMRILLDFDTKDLTVKALEEIAETSDTDNPKTNFKTIMKKVKEKIAEYETLELIKKRKCSPISEFEDYKLYKIIETYSQKEFPVIKDNKGNKYDAITLMKNIESEKSRFLDVINLKDKQGNPRFNEDEYLYAIQNLKYLNHRFFQYADITNADGTPAFSAKDCRILASPNYYLLCHE